MWDCLDVGWCSPGGNELKNLHLTAFLLWVVVDDAGFPSQERHKEWTKGSKTHSSDYSMQVRAFPAKVNKLYLKCLNLKQNPQSVI